MSAGAYARRLEPALYDSRVITVKELTQFANRGAFHMQKVALAACVSAIFAVQVYVVFASGGASLRAVAQLSRMAFLTISGVSYFLIAIMASHSAGRILTEEAAGKRLDVLRITALPLSAIVTGKAFAITARSLLSLVLITPVLAVASTVGGVEWRDVVRVSALVAFDAFFLAAAGLSGSMRRRTTVRSVVRMIVTAIIVIVVLQLSAVLFLTTRWPWLMVLHPFGGFVLLAQSRLTWGALALRCAVGLVGGLLLVRRASRRLERMAPALSEGRDGPAPAPRALIEPHPRSAPRVMPIVKRLVALYERAGRWTGPLVASQIAHTSILAVLAPAAILLGMWALTAIIALLSATWGYGNVEGVTLAGAIVPGFMLLVVMAYEACGLIAQEKARHTAEILAMAPMGGPSMLLWKPAGLAAAQSLVVAGIIAYTVLFRLTSRDMSALTLLPGLAGVCTLVCVLCMSLSLVVRKPEAALVYALLALVVVPLGGQAVILAAAERTSLALGSTVGAPLLAAGLLAVATAGMLARNLVPVIAAPMLAFSSGLAFAAWPLLFARGYQRVELPLIGPEAVFAPMWGGPVGARSAPGWTPLAFDLLLAAVILAGARVNFSSCLLRGTRTRGGK